MVSDLQLSLLGLGALLVGGVWAYNIWQERKYRRQIDTAFGAQAQPSADPLLNAAAEDETPAWAREAEAPEANLEIAPAQPASFDRSEPSPSRTFREETVAHGHAEELPQRVEPTFSEPSISEPVTPASAGTFPPEPNVLAERKPRDLDDPEVSIELTSPMPDAPDTSVAPPATAAPSAQQWPPIEWCDSSIDALARLDFDAPVAKDELQRAYRAMQDQLRLPLRPYVQLSSGSWQRLDEVLGGEFHTLCLALQLVDRHGPVTKAELDSLHHAAMGLVNLRKGHALFPNIAEAAEQARALDEFCAQLDLQLALNVLDAGHGAFPGTKIRGLAEAAGMQLMPNGEFHAFDENGNFLFALANMGEGFDAQNLRQLHTHGLTFLLDVPHVIDGGFAFERMLSTARQCANALSGTLVNAQRAPVTDTMVDGIRKKIFEIHEQMQIAGIAAGGPRALRLFS